MAAWFLHFVNYLKAHRDLFTSLYDHVPMAVHALWMYQLINTTTKLSPKLHFPCSKPTPKWHFPAPTICPGDNWPVPPLCVLSEYIVVEMEMFLTVALHYSLYLADRWTNDTEHYCWKNEHSLDQVTYVRSYISFNFHKIMSWESYIESTCVCV